MAEKVRNIIIENNAAKGVLMNNGDIIPAKNGFQQQVSEQHSKLWFPRDKFQKCIRLLEKIPQVVSTFTFL